MDLIPGQENLDLVCHMTQPKEKRKKLLQDGINGKVTSWSDIGLSSSVSYDFTVLDAVDMLTTALDMQAGKYQAKKDRIRKFVI